MNLMIRVLRLVLFLALAFGAVIAPEVLSAKVSDVAMSQMNAAERAEKSCDGCASPGFADSINCKGDCPVPCGSSGTAGILTWSPSASLAMSFGGVISVAEPLTTLGTKPLLDPFPPRLPV